MIHSYVLKTVYYLDFYVVHKLHMQGRTDMGKKLDNSSSRSHRILTSRFLQFFICFTRTIFFGKMLLLDRIERTVKQTLDNEFLFV